MTPKVQVLGGLSYEAEAAPSQANHRKRLMLLAVVACSDEGITRDALLPLFWPESTEARARNALKQGLYALRQILPEDALSGTAVLRLDPTRVTVDRSCFLGALDAGRLEEAVQQYGGPFLDGVHVSAGIELEHWIEAERARLGRRYASALDELTVGARSSGELGSAIRWARLRVEADRLASRPVLTLMELLAESGDAPSAIKLALAHECLVRVQLEMDADPAVTTFARSLRARTYPTPSPQPVPTGLQDSAAAPDEQASDLAEPPDPETPDASSRSERDNAAGLSRSAVGRAWLRRRSWLLRAVPARAAAVALLGLLGLSAAGVHLADGAAPRADARRVAVFPFLVRGGDAYLGPGIAELLSESLHGAGEITTVDPRALIGHVESLDEAPATPEAAAEIARHFGSAYFVFGSVMKAGERVRVHAALYRVDGARPLLRVQGEALADELFAFGERVGTRLLTSLVGPGRDRLARSAAASTHSFPAFRRYMEGEALFRAGEYAEAAARFQQATRLDPGFALAHYRLSVAADWGVVAGVDANAAAAEAVRHIARLPRYDRLLLRALMAFRAGDAAEAERRLRAALAQRPSDPEAWQQLAEVYFHLNPDRGRSFSEARQPFERALALDPRNREALSHLVRLAAADGDAAAIRDHAARVLALEPTSRLEVEGIRAFALGSAAEREAVIARVGDATPYEGYVLAWRLAAYAGDLHGAVRVAAAAANGERAVARPAEASAALVQLELARGRPGAALQILRRDGGLRAPMRIAEYRTHVLAHPLIPDSTRERLLEQARLDPSEVDRCAASALDPRCVPVLYAAGLEALHRGSPERARLIAAAIRRHDANGVRATAAASLDARRAFEARDFAAVPLLLPPHKAVGSGQHDAIDRLTRAEALAALGRTDEAVQWLGTIEHTTLPAMIYAAPARYRRAALLRAAGRSSEAEHDARALALYWRDAEPALRAQVGRFAELADSRAPRRQRWTAWLALLAR